MITAILLIASFPLPGQEKPVFSGETVEVRVVDVPVQVTDKDGNPIVNLSPEDFQLSVDGKSQPLKYFFEVKDSGTLRQSFAEAYKASGAKQPGIQPEFHKRIVIFLDGYHLHPHNYLRVESALETLLGTVMVEGDEASIFLAMPSVQRIQDWTDDVMLLKRTLREFKLSSTASTALPLRQRDMERIISSTSRYQFALQSVRGYAQERRYEILRVIDAMRAVLDINRTVSGEKYFIYVGEGIPTIPGLEYFYLLDKYFPRFASLNEATQYDLSHEFDFLGKFGASCGFTMYLVDSRGLVSSSPGFEADMSGEDYVRGMDVFGQSAVLRSSQDSLKILADATGGRAIVDTNDVKAGIGKFSLALNHYYSLAFEPGHPRDGAYHDIEVKIKNPEFVVSFRKGYVDFLPEENLPTRLQTFLVWDRVPHNPLNFGVRVEKSSKKGRYYLVPIKILFPKKSMPFTDGKTMLRVSIVIGDEQGRKSEAFTQKINLTSEMWKDSDTLAVPVKLQMRKGEQTMIVGVEDPFEDISYVRLTVKVPTGNDS